MTKKVDLPTQVDEPTPENPDWNWAFKMIGILIGVVIVSFISFYMFAYLVVGNISLETEKEIFGDIMIQGEEFQKLDKSMLGNKLKNFGHDLYVMEESKVNAFATLGGNIVLTEGLLEEVKYQEELLFVIGHEKEHIENRDPLKMILTNYPFRLSLSYLGSKLDFDISQIQKLIGKYLSKSMEIEADNGGIKFVKNRGGNLGCALAFFDREEDSPLRKYMEIVSSHPTTESRIQNIKEQIKGDPEKEECTEFDYAQN